MTTHTVYAPALRVQRFLALLVGLLWAATAIAAAKPSPEPNQAPDYAQLERMMKERMGKAQLRDQAATSDGVQVVLQTGHAAGITAVAQSRDGRYVLSGAQDETVKLWDVASGQEVRTLSGFDSLGLRGVFFSSDETRMIVADMGGISVFDLATGVKLRAHGGPSMSPLVSADGRVGVDAGSAGAVRAPRLVDLVTGAVIWAVPLQDAPDNVSAVALSADGGTLVTGKTGFGRRTIFSRQPTQPTYELQVWDVATRKLRTRLPYAGSDNDNISAIILSPDGRQLLMENRNRSLSVFDLASSKQVLNIPTGVAATFGMTTTLLYSPDGTRIAFATTEGQAKIWDASTGRLIASLDASALNFSADGKTIVLGRSRGGAPALRDLESSKETALAGGAEAILDLAVAADGREVVAAMAGGGAKLWSLATGQLLRSFTCASGLAASSVTVSPAMPQLAVGCMDGSVSLWDLNSGQKIRDLLPALSDGFAFAQARFSPNGRVLAVGVRDALTLFDAASGQQIRKLNLPAAAKPALLAAMQSQPSSELDSPDIEQGRNNIHAIALHPNGRLIVIGRPQEISVWDIETGEMLRRLGGVAASTDASAQATGDAVAGGASVDELMKQIGGGRGGRGGGLLGSLLGKGGSTPRVVMTNPMDLIQGIKEQMAGATSLAFSPDGRTILSVDAQGKRLWDLASGRPVRFGPAATFDPTNTQGMMDAMLGEEMGEADGTAFSPDGKLAAHGIGRVVKITDVTSGRDVAQLIGHTSNVSAVAFVDGGRLLVSGGRDGALRVWSVPEGKEAAAFIALGQSDYVAVTPDQYYRASRSRIKGVAFRVNEQLYPFEQFDLRFNRPDILLQRLGLAAPEAVLSYRQSYERRLHKMGFNESMLGTDFHLPEVAILTQGIPVSTAETSLKLLVSAADDKYALDRFNVFVNDVPIYGTAGLALTAKGAQRAEQEITAPLVAGRNKVQVSVLNAQGAESLKRTVYVNSSADQGPADIYVVAIGVSDYKNSAYNLRYAAKDAGDFLKLYGGLNDRPAPHGQVHLLEVTNAKATRDGIRQARAFLRQARVNDLAVVFAAGHGMTNAKQNYYFGTWDIDPAAPDVNGLPYEDFEALLDGIPALQKMLLIDTCFSGEIDKDEPTLVTQTDAGSDGTVKMRSFKAQRGVAVVADSGGAAAVQSASDLVRFQQDWFADLRRGTGAVVISSASGNEFALEGEQWHNGVFTYALLNGLKNRAADADKDGIVTVSELQSYVIEQVRKLTAGGQNPTVRRENLDYDFAVF